MNKTCPRCGSEVTFGFGLAGGLDKDGKLQGYEICLDCDWQEPKARETICFPDGIVESDPYS